MTAVEHLIKIHFGTQQALADFVGVGQNTVSGWNTRNSIPHKHQRQIVEKAKKLGLNITPKDFFPSEAASA